MTNGQQQPPVIDGIPVTGMPGVWRYSFHELGADEATAEKIFLLRLHHAAGVTEVFMPASFARQMAEHIALQAAGLHIARDIPSHPGAGEGP